MKLFQDDLEPSFEDMYNVATLEELNAMNMEMNTLTNTLDVSSKYLSILENNKLSLESMLNDNVSADTLKISIENINMIYDMLGINNIRISNESIDDMVKISVESIGESISKGYEAVKKVIAKIIEAIKNFFKKIWNFLFGKEEKVAKKELVDKKAPKEVKEAIKVASDPKATEDKKDEAIAVIIETVEVNKPETNPLNISPSIVAKYKGKKAELRGLRGRAKTGNKEAIADVEVIDNIASDIGKKRVKFAKDVAKLAAMSISNAETSNIDSLGSKLSGLLNEDFKLLTTLLNNIKISIDKAISEKKGLDVNLLFKDLNDGRDTTFERMSSHDIRSVTNSATRKLIILNKIHNSGYIHSLVLRDGVMETDWFHIDQKKVDTVSSLLLANIPLPKDGLLLDNAAGSSGITSKSYANDASKLVGLASDYYEMMKDKGGEYNEKDYKNIEAIFLLLRKLPDLAHYSINARDLWMFGKYYEN